MKKYVLLAYGYEQPTKEVVDAWMKWFDGIKDHVVDSGNPFGSGVEITKQGNKKLTKDSTAVTGYTIINAENLEQAVELAQKAPITTSMRVYEAVSM